MQPYNIPVCISFNINIIHKISSSWKAEGKKKHDGTVSQQNYYMVLPKKKGSRKYFLSIKSNKCKGFLCWYKSIIIIIMIIIKKNREKKRHKKQKLTISIYSEYRKKRYLSYNNIYSYYNYYYHFGTWWNDWKIESAIVTLYVHYK